MVYKGNFHANVFPPTTFTLFFCPTSSLAPLTLTFINSYFVGTEFCVGQTVLKCTSSLLDLPAAVIIGKYHQT